MAKSVVKSDILTTVHEQYINSWHPESQTLTRLASRIANFTMLNRQATRRTTASEPRVHTGVLSGMLPRPDRAEPGKHKRRDLTMANQIIKQKQTGKYSAFLLTPENGAKDEDGKAPPVKALAEFSPDGEILIKGQFEPENIRLTKKAGAPYISLAWNDSYPLRAGTATVYLSSSFTKELDE